ncbi:MAG TPA: hypothetical protein VGD30_06155 [Telluria sp.]
MMRLGELAGTLFIGAGVLVGVMKYSLPWLHWVFGSILLVSSGLAIIWLSSRERKTREMLDGADVPFLGHRPRSNALDHSDADD